MTEQEYIEKAKELGYSKEEIEEEIKLHNSAKQEGVNIPFELALIEKPEDVIKRNPECSYSDVDTLE